MVSLGGKQAAKCFLHEIADILRRHAAFEDRGDIGTLGGIERLRTGLPPEGLPVVGW